MYVCARGAYLHSSTPLRINLGPKRILNLNKLNFLRLSRRELLVFCRGGSAMYEFSSRRLLFQQGHLNIQSGASETGFVVGDGLPYIDLNAYFCRVLMRQLRHLLQAVPLNKMNFIPEVNYVFIYLVLGSKSKIMRL
jgi:hypothetical protein